MKRQMNMKVNQKLHIMSYYLDHETTFTNFPGSYWKAHSVVNYVLNKYLGKIHFVGVDTSKDETWAHLLNPTDTSFHKEFHLNDSELLTYALKKCPQYLTFTQVWLSFIKR